MRAMDGIEPADGVADALREALRENERLTDRSLAAEQQVGDLATLYAAVNSLHGATDPHAVVATVCEIVANLVGSEEMALFESDARNEHIKLVATCGVAASRFDSLEVGTGVIGAVAETGRPFVRQEGGRWRFDAANGLKASIYLPTIDCTLALADVYALVEWDEDTVQ